MEEPSEQIQAINTPELRIFRDAVPIAAGMAVGSWSQLGVLTTRGHRYLNEKYSAALLVQTPHVPPGRLGKEGAVRSEMQITLDWVSPSQTSPARIAFPASSVSKQRDDLGEMHHSTKGRAGRGFLSSQLQSVWSYSKHMASSPCPQRRTKLGTPR